MTCLVLYCFHTCYSCIYDNSSLLCFLILSVLFPVLVFFSTSSLLWFFISYEFRLLPVAILILFFGYQPEKLRASTYLLAYTVISSIPLLFFVVLFPSFIWGLGTLAHSFLGPLLVLSFMVKTPLYTLHSWLPKAHLEAPLLGSIILAGVMLKLGGYGLFVLTPLLGINCYLYFFLSLSGGVCCSLLCFRSWDVKSLVAYSSVVHIGTVTLGMLSFTELGAWVGFGMIVSHGLISPMLFKVAHVIYSVTGSRSMFYSLFCSFTGLILLTVGCFSGLNFGLPPSLSFMVEFSLFVVLDNTFLCSVPVLCFSSLLVFLYCVIFYICSVGLKAGPIMSGTGSVLIFLPSFVFCLLLTFCGSAFMVT